MSLAMEELERYLKGVFKEAVRVKDVRRIGGEGEDIKEVGYGTPQLIEAEVGGRLRKFVMNFVAPGPYGHEYMPDRAQVVLLAHKTYNKLPKHVKSFDCGGVTSDGRLISVGDIEEFFVLMEYAEGTLYKIDLDRISEEKKLKQIDIERARALSDYLVEIHKVKRDEPNLYIRRVRDLVGHGEGLMGLLDTYTPSPEYATTEDLIKIEKRCVEWRWKLKKFTHRLSVVHGDYHPWNVLFREGTDFTLLDRSRGEWGEPADDVTSMSINYFFFSVITFGELTGPFKQLFELFYENYLDKTGDEELLKVVQPFYAWRGAVISHPQWYPTLTPKTRRKLLNFIRNVLECEVFNPKEVNSYLKDT
ncbi:MAG: phosphotransferase family protein [Candidatus Freyarchaeota archaeon]